MSIRRDRVTAVGALSLAAGGDFLEGLKRHQGGVGKYTWGGGECPLMGVGGE